MVTIWNEKIKFFSERHSDPGVVVFFRDFVVQEIRKYLTQYEMEVYLISYSNGIGLKDRISMGFFFN